MPDPGELMARDQATFELERALSHHLAHDLNNAFGAIEVFAEMVAEDVRDSAARGRIEKIRMAALAARQQVDVLRRAIPKYSAGQGITDLKKAIELAQTMMGDAGERVQVSPFPQGQITLDGEISVITYILYQIISHAAGGSSGPVTVTHEVQGQDVVITCRAQGRVNDLSWERPFFDNVLKAHRAQVVFHSSNEDSTDHSGFFLHWPMVPL